MIGYTTAIAYSGQSTIFLNNLRLSDGFIEPNQYYYIGGNSMPLSPDDVLQLNGGGCSVFLMPCKYVTEQLLASPAAISNELGGGGQSPLEKLLIKEYRPFTEEEIKEMEEANSESQKMGSA